LALITPVVSQILPYSANTENTITFSVGSGGSQVTQNKINVYNSTNALLYTNTTQTFLLQSIIPTNTLTNSSATYKVTIQTGDINNNWSTESDAVVFYCLSNPILTVTNIISGQVFNQNVTFSTTYSQAQSEILQSYLYNIYDLNQNLLQSYPNTYADGSSPLTQLIQGLANNTLYYVEVKTVSVNGQQGTSGLISFIPLYVSPSLYSTLSTTPNNENGSITVDAIIIQEIANVDTGTVIYQDGTWINLTQGCQISFEDGFSIDGSEFVVKIWGKNVPNDIVFCTIYSPEGKITLLLSGNQIHGYIYVNNIVNPVSHFISNEVTIGVDVVFMIYVKYQYGLLDLYLTLV